MEISPAAFAAMGAEFASGVEAAGFSFTHGEFFVAVRGRRSGLLHWVFFFSGRGGGRKLNERWWRGGRLT